MRKWLLLILLYFVWKRNLLLLLHWSSLKIHWGGVEQSWGVNWKQWRNFMWLIWIKTWCINKWLTASKHIIIHQCRTACSIIPIYSHIWAYRNLRAFHTSIFLLYHWLLIFSKSIILEILTIPIGISHSLLSTCYLTFNKLMIVDLLYLVTCQIIVVVTEILLLIFIFVLSKFTEWSRLVSSFT